VASHRANSRHLPGPQGAWLGNFRFMPLRSTTVSLAPPRSHTAPPASSAALPLARHARLPSVSASILFVQTGETGAHPGQGSIYTLRYFTRDIETRHLF